MTALDKTDETSKWLMSCMGSASGADYAVRAKAAVASSGVVKISGFEL